MVGSKYPLHVQLQNRIAQYASDSRPAAQKAPSLRVICERFSSRIIGLYQDCNTVLERRQGEVLPLFAGLKKEVVARNMLIADRDESYGGDNVPNRFQRSYEFLKTCWPTVDRERRLVGEKEVYVWGIIRKSFPSIIGQLNYLSERVDSFRSMIADHDASEKDRKALEVATKATAWAKSAFWIGAFGLLVSGGSLTREIVSDIRGDSGGGVHEFAPTDSPAKDDRDGVTTPEGDPAVILPFPAASSEPSPDNPPQPKPSDAPIPLPPQGTGAIQTPDN
jgi:hypothetical protein